jgi:hypothetical protein
MSTLNVKYFIVNVKHEMHTFQVNVYKAIRARVHELEDGINTPDEIGQIVLLELKNHLTVDDLNMIEVRVINAALRGVSVAGPCGLISDF